MLIKITEFCAWENEKWSYVLDFAKQDMYAMNQLMIFIRVANEFFEKAKKEAAEQPSVLPYHPIFNRNPRNPFAASRYHIEFYDSIELSKERVILVHSEGRLSMSNNGGYKSNSYDLDLIVSKKRMHSALVRMRDKKENVLYKNFEYLFLTKKISRGKEKINSQA